MVEDFLLPRLPLLLSQDQQYYPLNNKQEHREDYGMTRTKESHFPLKKAESTVQQLGRRLQCWSCDLTDARHLMRRFQASVTDFQQALARLDKSASYCTCKGECTSWITYK